MVRLRVAFVSVVLITLPVMAQFGFSPLLEPPADLFAVRRASPGLSFQSKRTIEFPQLIIENNGLGSIRVAFPGSLPLRVETMPEVPYLEQTLPFIQGAEVEALLDNPQLELSPTGIPLAMQAETSFWTKDSSFRPKGIGDSRYFPGKWVETYRTGNQWRIRFFPVQWDRQSHALVYLKQAHLQIYSNGGGEQTPSGTSSVAGVILVRRGELESAKLLQRFQKKNYGVVSDIAIVEDIAQDSKELGESEYPEGYTDRKSADAIVQAYDSATGKGFDYSLARKIAQFLRDIAVKNSSLKYVTLLGDELAVPPSYYFSIQVGTDKKFGVTDQCYVAKKLCAEPFLAVGRLPFQTIDEMQSYLAKVQAWIASAAGASSEISLFGGKAFNGPFYIGELGALRALPHDADWTGVRKFFRTKQNYMRSEVLETFSGNRDSLFVYSLDHALGNSWFVEKEIIGSKDIQALKAAGPQVAPMLFSNACAGAAYDSALLKGDPFDDMSFGSESIGVALLRSPAGVVGYFGAARAALGAPVFEIDASGNLSLKDSNHGLKLLDSALEEYRRSSGAHLGDYVFSSLSRYATDPASSLVKDRYRWTYLNAVLLADPAMILPVRKNKEVVFDIAKAVDVIEVGFKGFFPALLLSETGGAQLRVNTATKVEATLLVQSPGLRLSETEVSQQELGPGDSDIAFVDELGRQNYFLRLENSNGVPVERQVWFRTQ